MTHQKLFDHMSQEKKCVYCHSTGLLKLHGETYTKCLYCDGTGVQQPKQWITLHQVEDKLTELKNNLEIARIAHSCATGITKKNIGISMTCIEYAISVLKELVG